MKTRTRSLSCAWRCLFGARRRMTASAAIASPVVKDAPALLQVAGLTKRYGDQHALAEVSFEVNAGEVLGLIGPNGAGKTTLLEALAGVLPADAGDVLWRSVPMPGARRRDVMFYLPDGLRPWEDQFALQVLKLFAAVYGRTQGQLDDAIHCVGLLPVLGKRVAALSKGYARRLM